ncbi:MAG: tetratricopeptide repeat protein [Candidatus Humimicrobiaceae bacterium]
MSRAYYHFRKGKKLAGQNNFIHAIMHLEKAKEEEPEKASIREVLARAYYNCGFYSPARDNFQKAVEIDAANDFAYYGLGLSLAKLGKIKRAIGQLKIAVTMKPQSEDYKKALEKLTP